MMRRSRFVLDADALGRLYAVHASGFVVFFAKRLRVRSDALDLTAETFARAFAARDSFRGASESQAVAWLYGIARNLLLQHVRDAQIELRALARLAVEPAAVGDEALERALSSDHDERLLRQVAGVLAGLPPGQRRALIGRVVEELTYEELASELGVSEDAARARVSRGVRALRGRLEDAR